MNRKNGIHAKSLFQPKVGFKLTFTTSNFQDGKIFLKNLELEVLHSYVRLNTAIQQ